MFVIYLAASLMLFVLFLIFLPTIIWQTKSFYRTNVAAPAKTWFSEVVAALKS
jgi:hypothetical protein